MLNVQFLSYSSFSIVVAVTFIVITLITVVSLFRYYQIFSFLKQLKTEMYRDPNFSAFLQKMKHEYARVSEDGTKNISAESFVESHLYEYTTNNGKGLIAPLRWIQSAGNVVILIGVLGTFIGLVLSLSHINYEEMNQSVLQLLNGIHTAFYTSIFGILSSIIIHVFTKKFPADQLLSHVMVMIENELNKNISNSKDEKILARLQDVTQAIHGLNESVTGLVPFSNQFKQASQHLVTFNKTFAQNVNQLTNHFQESQQLVQALHQEVTQLDTHFTEMTDAFSQQKQLITTFDAHLQAHSKQVNESTHHQQKQQAAINHLLQTIKEEKSNMQSFFSATQSELQDLSQQTNQFYDQTLSQQKQLTQSQERLNHKNNQLLQNVEKATQSMKEMIDQGAFDQLNETSVSLSVNIKNLENRFQQFSQFLQKLDQKEQHFVHYLAEQLNEMKQLTNQLQQEHRTYTHYLQNFVTQNEMTDTSIKEVVSILKNYDENGRQLSNMMRQISNEINQKFTENDRTQQQHTEKLLQSLEAHTHQLEKTNESIYTFLKQMENQSGLAIKRLDQLLHQLTDSNQHLQILTQAPNPTINRKDRVMK